MQIEIAQLIADIHTAFDGVRRDDGISLHEAEEIDCHGSPEELKNARQLDTDTRWQDIPDERIRNYPSAFSYLDPKGFRYYLPAVMLWHFRHMHWSEPASADLVCSLLTDTRFSYGSLLELLHLLTEEQKRVTARWLFLYLSEYNEPESHLKSLRESCWGKYLSE